MSSETTEGGPPEPGKKKILPIVLVVLAGSTIGGGAGVFVAAPLLAERSVPVAEAVAAEGEGAGEDSVADRDAGPGAMYVLENLVLNPAGSGGTRFLMVTLALQVRDDGVAEKVRVRDAEVRDRVLQILGKKTVDELASTSLRNALKEELRAEIEALLDPGSVRRVYLPQFVIQ